MHLWRIQLGRNQVCKVGAPTVSAPSSALGMTPLAAPRTPRPRRLAALVARHHNAGFCVRTSRERSDPSRATGARTPTLARRVQHVSVDLPTNKSLDHPDLGLSCTCRTLTLPAARDNIETTALTLKRQEQPLDSSKTSSAAQPTASPNTAEHADYRFRRALERRPES
jgi:hypothetical protein